MNHPIRVVPSSLSLVLLLMPVAPVGAGEVERRFERSFPVEGQVTLDAVTNTGRVDVRTGSDGRVVVRGIIKRNPSWHGFRITDEQIEKLREAPPVRADGDTILVERPAEEAVWRGVAIDYEVVVPTTARLRVTTASGSVSIAGSRDEVRVETGSGAVLVDAADGAVDLRTGSGSVRVSGSANSLAMATQSGSIEARVASVAVVEASSGSGSITVSGVRGTAHAETGSGRITIEGSPTGAWTVRSRSGSLSLRVPHDSRFDVSARSRSGSVEVAFPVAGRDPSAKHVVEGKVNGGGPKLDLETGSSSITVR